VYGTACLDTKTFKTLWKRDDLPCRHYRGPASSLVLFENLLILSMDGVDVQYHVALDKKTGKTIWKTNRSVRWNDEHINTKLAKDGDQRKAHSTPLIVTINGKLQMLSAGAKASYAYDPRTGKELWRFQFPNSWSAAPMPLFSHGLVFLISGLGKNELVAIRPDGKGDITETHLVWKMEKTVAKTASPIIVGDLLYMARDDGIVTCVEAVNGNQVWSERLGGTFASSPVYADGRLYFFNQQGKGFVLKPGITCDVLATNTLDIGCMASPAVDGKALFVRTKTHLYRIESATR
jgi:outer membrane protein assembly factor BamB